MTEKLNEYKITSRDGNFINADCNAKIINTLVRKINELVDVVNELQARPTNALTKTLRMDKELAEDECMRLQNELERAKKQLEIYHKFVTKLYLNGDIKLESLKRLQKLLYIQNKGGNNE